MTKNGRRTPIEEENNVWPSWQNHDPATIGLRGFKNNKWILVPIGIFVLMNLVALIRYGLPINATVIAQPLILAILPEYASLLIVIFGILYGLRLWRKPPTPFLADVIAYTLVIFFGYFIFIALSVGQCDGPVGNISCAEQPFLWARVILSMSPIMILMKVLLIIGIVSLLIRRKGEATKASRAKRPKRVR